jgi:hypothetical protein
MKKDKLQPLCPSCKSCEVIPLLSVLPGTPPWDTADIGRLPVAQCVELEGDEVDTRWECKECGNQWGGGEESGGA